VFDSPVIKPETGARGVLKCAGVCRAAGRAGWRSPFFSEVISDVRSSERVAQRAQGKRARGTKSPSGTEEGCSLVPRVAARTQACSLGARGCSVEPRKRTGLDHHVHDKPAAGARAGGWAGRRAGRRAGGLWRFLRRGAIGGGGRHACTRGAVGSTRIAGGSRGGQRGGAPHAYEQRRHVEHRRLAQRGQPLAAPGELARGDVFAEQIVHQVTEEHRHPARARAVGCGRWCFCGPVAGFVWRATHV
jgi:hypothetical protein